MATGLVSRVWMAFISSAVVLMVLVGILAWPQRPRAVQRESLFVYCAAGLQAPVSAVAAEYEKMYGVRVEVQYQGSNTLLSNAEATRRGDLFLPADDSYIEMARARALIDEVVPLARMRPVIGVKKGNPKNIRGLDDLLRPGTRMSQANPDAAAIGAVVRKALRASGQWDAIEKHVTVEKGTVNDVATDVQIGTVDAAFLWDAIVRQTKDLEAVEVPAWSGVSATISVAVLKSTRQPTAALRFARYLGARDRGLLQFKKYGFDPVDGDAWAFAPELRVYAGAMLQAAVDPTIAAFEQREGVKVTRVYNGCGILVAQMRSGQRPDAYFACDKSFMRQVSDLYMEGEDISRNEIVIITAKGNPHRIRTLEDLGTPGLKIGIGHEQQSALGALTKKVLVEGGCYERVMKNVVVQSATGDHLMNQLSTGSLDAVLAYVSNAAKAGGAVEVIPVDVPAAKAIQPLAVANGSQYKQLAGRLAGRIKSAESRRHFEDLGFKWQAKADQR